MDAIETKNVVAYIRTAANGLKEVWHIEYVGTTDKYMVFKNGTAWIDFPTKDEATNFINNIVN
jgi:hypothetical protein